MREILITNRDKVRDPSQKKKLIEIMNLDIAS